MQGPRRVEDEQGEEDEVEEVDRRGREERREQRRGSSDEAETGGHLTVPRILGGRFLGLDRAKVVRGQEEGHGVGGERVRRRQNLHDHAPDARTGDEREGSASCEQGVRLHVALARHHRDEEGVVRDEEEDAESTGEERDEVELREGQRVECVRDRDRPEQNGAPQVGGDHRLPAEAPAIDQRTGVQRKEQVRDERGRAQVAHLSRAGVQHEDRSEGQREQRDLVAEQRDRLAEPETAERQIPQRLWQRELHVRSVVPGGGLLSVAAAVLTGTALLPGPAVGAGTSLVTPGRLRSALPALAARAAVIV